MSASIVSGAGSSVLTIDPGVLAARTVQYSPSGTAVGINKTASTNLSASNASCTLTEYGFGAVTATVQGTFSGTLTFQATNDGVYWFPTAALPANGAGPLVTTTTTTGAWVIPNHGFSAVRLSMTTYTSGTASVVLSGGGSGSGFVVLGAGGSLTLGAGANAIGSVTISTGANTIGAVNLNAGTNILGSTNASPNLNFITGMSTLSNGMNLTLPAPGSSNFHNISDLIIRAYAGGTITAAAAPIQITTTNLNGLILYNDYPIGGMGSSTNAPNRFNNPLKSQTSNTATIISAPAVTNVVWYMEVYYRIGV